MNWIKIQDGMKYPFIDVYTKIGDPDSQIRVGILKVEGNIGEKVTWAVIHYNLSTRKKVMEKDFKGKSPRDKAKLFAIEYMKTH